MNVPVDIASTVNTVIPHNLSDTDTIPIKFKRKKEYKNVSLKKILDQW